ncbi:MAG: hypothetical protein AAGI08_17850, partial [Bacteroidota bacterium]
LQLLTETLFFDPEQGTVGSVSLISNEDGRELYMAAYDPDEDLFIIEKATDWDPPEEAVEGVRFALDGDTDTTHETPEDTASALLGLAKEQNLEPSIAFLLEEME